MIYKQRDRHSQVVEERCVDRQVIILTMKRAKYRRIDIAVVAFETKSNKDEEATELETKQHRFVRLISVCFKILINAVLAARIIDEAARCTLTSHSFISEVVSYH